MRSNAMNSTSASDSDLVDWVQPDQRTPFARLNLTPHELPRDNMLIRHDNT